MLLNTSVKSVCLVIDGRIPSKKNSRNIFVRNGRICNVPSTKYAAWHKTALLQIVSCDTWPLKNIDNVALYFYAPDKRGTDLTNKAESIMDLLVDKGVLEDDNWWIVPKIHLYFMGVDKENPRCEIHIQWNEPC